MQKEVPGCKVACLCCAGLTAAMQNTTTLSPSLRSDCGFPQVKTRRLLPDHNPVARDAVTAVLGLGRWLQHSCYYPSLSAVDYLSLIDLKYYEQSPY